MIVMCACRCITVVTQIACFRRIRYSRDVTHITFGRDVSLAQSAKVLRLGTLAMIVKIIGRRVQL